MEYSWNEQAELTARHIIEKHHPRLAGAKIAYLFKVKPEAPKPKRIRDGKKLTWAKASLVGPEYRSLMEQGYAFIIEFDQQVWDWLTLEQQEALVDHELCHCGNDADGFYMRAHDLEEFRCIVQRHGFWKDDVKEFAEAALPLFEKA